MAPWPHSPMAPWPHGPVAPQLDQCSSQGSASETASKKERKKGKWEEMLQLVAKKNEKNTTLQQLCDILEQIRQYKHCAIQVFHVSLTFEVSTTRETIPAKRCSQESFPDPLRIPQLTNHRDWDSNQKDQKAKNFPWQEPNEPTNT